MIFSVLGIYIYIIVTGFKKGWLPQTQQQGTLFTITLLVLKVTQVAFAVACFWDLSDVHKCLDNLHQTILSPLDKQMGSWNSPHNWLMSLAMDLAALCGMWSWNWHQWMPSGCFQCVNVAFTHHFVAPTTPPPYRVLVVLATPEKTI